MNIFVTGAAGFIGSNFVRWLLDNDDACITGYDSLTYAGNMENLGPALRSSRFRFIKGDIRDAEAVGNAFRETKPDAVVNFAAESHVDRSIADPSLFIDTNVAGTGVLLDAAVRYGIPTFHQVSTDEVYGDLPLDSGEPFTESSPLRPSSPYSASKAGADLLALSYARTYGLHVTISRCTNNYGPNQHPEKLIPKTVTSAFHDKPITIYGTGRNVRDWIYADDHCRAISMILRNGRSGRIYNVGADCPISNIDLVRKILTIMGKPLSLISYVPDRKGHDMRYALDSSRIREELGFSAESDFTLMLEKTIAFFEKQLAASPAEGIT